MPNCERRNSDWDLRWRKAVLPSNDPGFKTFCLQLPVRHFLTSTHPLYCDVTRCHVSGHEAGVGRPAALATGSCEFFGEWKMSYGET